MSGARVGVVIPVYNHERYVGATIGSVLGQGLAPWRVIAIDDGSTDRSAEEARAAGGGRVEVVTQANAGAHAAINRGIEMADDCEYVAILNSDDLYHPARLERCAGAMGPGIDALFTRLEVIGESGGPLGADHPRARWFDAAWSLARSDLSLAESLGVANYPATTSNLFARRAWLRARPFRPYRYVHDYFAFAGAAIEGALGFLDEPLLRYRVHGANTISTAPGLLVRELLEMNVDLVREYAVAAAGDGALRGRLTSYLRALWANVSAARADLLAHVFARLARGAGEGDLRRWIDEAASFPEAGEYPNRALVNAHEGAASLGVHSGLSDKYAGARARCSALAAELRELRGELRLRERLARSRWVSLGVALGPARDLARCAGADLARRVAASRWLRLGRALGIRSARVDVGEEKT